MKTINHKTIYILILGICMASVPLSTKAITLPLPCDSLNCNQRTQQQASQQPYQTNSYTPDTTSSQSPDFPCIEPKTIPVGYNRATDCILTPQALSNKNQEQNLEQEILKTSFGAKLYDYCGRPPYTYSTKGPISHADWMKCAQAVELNIESTMTKNAPAPEIQIATSSPADQIFIDIRPVIHTPRISAPAPEVKKPALVASSTATTTATQFATTTPKIINKGLLQRFLSWLGF